MATTIRTRPNSIRIDWPLAIAALLLLGVGFMSLYSEGFARDHLATFKKQLLFAGMGAVPFLLFFFVKPDFWARVSSWLYAINVLALVAVRVMGSAKNGSERWIEIGPVQFQPSEMAKLLTIITLSAFFANRTAKAESFSTYALSFLHVAVPVVLILLQPHLGAALVIVVAWIAICLVAEVPFKFLAGTGVAFLCLIGLMVAVPSVSNIFLHDYQKGRVKGLFSHDEQGSNYQTSQAEIAFGMGGVMGTGYMKGTQKESKFIPEQENDFIFTVVGEEGGLIGAGLVLVLFGFFFYRVWLVMYSAASTYYRCLAAGIFAALFFHMFVNVAMVLEIVPVVGLWLPFLSYGGTALWLCFACVGLLLSIRRVEKPVLFS